jgi:hypothetical protein
MRRSASDLRVIGRFLKDEDGSTARGTPVLGEETGMPVTPQRLDDNNYEERGASWSPDGTRIVFARRRSGPGFEICVINADGTGLPVQLIANDLVEGTPTLSPDGEQILFHRTVGAQSSGNQHPFIMNADGTNQMQLTFGTRTTPDGLNTIANWGEGQGLSPDDHGSRVGKRCREGTL